MNIATVVKRLATPMLLGAAAALTLAACQEPQTTAPTGDEMAEATIALEPIEEPMEEPVTEPIVIDEAPMAGAVTIAVATSDVHGDYLVDGDGMALYLFLSDTPTTSACTGGCADNWPPVIADGDPTAGPGVDAMLFSAIARDDNTLQVTYNGHPLYWYAADTTPADTNGHGVGDVWYLITPDGEQID